MPTPPRTTPQPPARRLRRAALAALLLVAPAATAYIPSAASLLRKAAARAGEGGRSKEAALAGWLQAGGAAPAAATLTLRFPLACRLESQGRSAEVRVEASGPAAQDGGLGAGALELLRLACPFVAYRGLPAADAEAVLRAAAARAGVPPELAPTSLTRLYDRVAVVLGAGPRQLERPQLWLYKDSAAPARLLAREGDRLDDLRFLQYGNPAAGDWFPRALELWRGEQLLARFEALEIRGFKDAPAAEEPEDAD